MACTLLFLFLFLFLHSYGFLLPLFGDNQHKKVGGKYICVYEGKLWATIDTVAFVAVWVLLFYLVHALRRVNDQFGPLHVQPKSETRNAISVY